MKKIIVSAAVAALALTTTASALEDIKVNGQAKIWYETNNGGNNDLFNKTGSSAEAVFKLGMTGKQGNVGFGATVYDSSTMGLEGLLVNGVRTNTNNLITGTNDQMYVGEAYITAPVAGSTLKLGKQELDTPLLYTERWNAAPNTFNAAVAIVPASDDLTVIGAYVGQVSTAGSFQTTGTPTAKINPHGAYALAALYKNDTVAVNAWYYSLPTTAMALWVDAAVKAGPVDVKAYLAHMMEDEDLDANSDDSTTAVALSGAMGVSGVKLFAAASMVTEDGALHVGNYGTGGKKTNLPTKGVYLDGKAVAQPGATAVKVKAAGKVGATGLAAQLVSCTNDAANGGVFSAADESAMELDLIATAKLGDFNIKGILMHRDFENTDAQQHVRLITSINF